MEIFQWRYTSTDVKLIKLTYQGGGCCILLPFYVSVVRHARISEHSVFANSANTAFVLFVARISQLVCSLSQPNAVWLTQRTQRVVVNGYDSNFVQVQSGVPQGTVLGPLMFLLYINDIKCGISSHLKLFADDCILYRTINSQQDQLLHIQQLSDF